MRLLILHSRCNSTRVIRSCDAVEWQARSRLHGSLDEAHLELRQPICAFQHLLSDNEAVIILHVNALLQALQ